MKNLSIFCILFFLLSCGIAKNPGLENVTEKRELEVLQKSKNYYLISSEKVEKSKQLFIKMPSDWIKTKSSEDGFDLRILFEKSEEEKLIVMTNKFDGSLEELPGVALSIAEHFGIEEVTSFYQTKINNQEGYFSFGKLQNNQLIGLATIKIEDQGYIFFCFDKTKKLLDCSSIIKTLQFGLK